MTFEVDKFEVEATDSFHCKTSITLVTAAQPSTDNGGYTR